MLKTIQPQQPVDGPITTEQAIKELRLQGLSGVADVLPSKIAAGIAVIEAKLGRTLSAREFEFSYTSGNLSVRLPFSWGDFTLVEASYTVGAITTIFSPSIAQDECGTRWIDAIAGYPIGARVSVRYSVNNDMPPEVRSACLLMIGHLFENREATVVGVQVNQLPLGVDYLIEHHRVDMGA